MIGPDQYESAAAALEASGDYRILRQLPQLSPLPLPMTLGRGLFVDVETTGLDPFRDEIIQVAMVPFAFVGNRIVGVGDVFMRYREPSIPIPPKVTQLTGIDLDTVMFTSIDPDELECMASGVDLVVAHNAVFDRRFLERYCHAFTALPWACSMSQVPWADEGFDGTKLGYLVAHAGFFYKAHRADADCLAALVLLTMPLPISGETAFSKMLATSQQPTLRVWAVGAPYEAKDILRARGYRWNGGEDGRPKSWYRDIPVEEREAEGAFLVESVYLGPRAPIITEITAVNRFSDRF